MLMLALALFAQDPSPEALALGKRLAETGTLAAMLPMVIAEQREELIAEHPEWSDADKAAMRKLADEMAEDGRRRLIAAIGRGYAERLSVADLRVLVVFNEGEAAKRWREATPGAVAAAMQAFGGVGFKDEARATFCAKTGKGCPTR
jgi:hypothetical protein